MSQQPAFSVRVWPNSRHWRSARVMETPDMTYDRTIREQAHVKGRFNDLRMYSILRREWPPRSR